MAIDVVPTTSVPFVDLAAIHAELKEDILRDVERVIDASAFINGAPVAAFESAFAASCGTAHAVGVSSGLDALRLGLLATGCTAEDEVILPAHTFVATLEAVMQAGGKPVLVDVAEDDFNLDPAAAEAAVSARTRFLLPVHLYGQMADMQRLRSLAEARSIHIVEDACQAHGATRDGLRAGAIGHAAAFSFYPSKNLGAMGDAGALTTDDPGIADVARALREHGQRTRHRFELAGYTARLDTIQAVVLGHKLPRLEAWNAVRRDIARRYSEALAGVGDLRLPKVAPGSDPVWYAYVVRTRDPEGLVDYLAARGIGTGRHYPWPIHLSPAYTGLGHRRGAFPVTEAVAAQALSLPIFPGMHAWQLEAVVDAVRAYFAHAPRGKSIPRPPWQ